MSHDHHPIKLSRAKFEDDVIATYNPDQPFHYPPAICQQPPAECPCARELAMLRIELEEARSRLRTIGRIAGI